MLPWSFLKGCGVQGRDKLPQSLWLALDPPANIIGSRKESFEGSLQPPHGSLYSFSVFFLSFISVFFFFCCCCNCLFCFGITLGNTQDFLLSLLLGIPSGSTQGTIWDDVDQTQFSRVQGKHPPRCPSTRPTQSHSAGPVVALESVCV